MVVVGLATAGISYAAELKPGTTQDKALPAQKSDAKAATGKTPDAVQAAQRTAKLQGFEKLLDAHSKDLAELRKQVENRANKPLKPELDKLRGLLNDLEKSMAAASNDNEMSTADQMKLQQLMTRRSQMMAMLTQIMEMENESKKSILQNIR